MKLTHIPLSETGKFLEAQALVRLVLLGIIFSVFGLSWNVA